MIERDSGTIEEQDPDQRAGRITSRIALPMQPPKDLRVEREGSVLRLIVKDHGRYIAAEGVSGADHYAIYWAEDVDETSRTTIDAGAARATHIGAIQRAFLEGKDLTFDVTSALYQNGYFYVFGANILGDRSETYLFSGRQSGETLDDTIPDDVLYFDASESGEQHTGAVVSAIAFSYFAPLSPSFAGVQFVLEHYPNVNQVTRHHIDEFTGPLGGKTSDKFTALSARRIGIGPITVNNGFTAVNVPGGLLLTQARPGDVLEILGVRGTINTVTDNENMTLTAGWAGVNHAGFAEWLVLGLVNVYANAISKAGTYKSYATAPMKALLFDGELSAPLAPLVSVVTAGNVIRAYVSIAAGTQLDHVVLYRGTGVAILFDQCSPVKTWPADQIAASATVVYEDTDFTVFQRENGQVFTYYAVAVNVRGEKSPPSIMAQASCRLDSTGENTPTLPRFVPNQLWNGHINGTVGASVRNPAAAPADPSQDTNMGGAPPTGRGQWYGVVLGVGSLPGHISTTEVVLAMTGAGAGTSALCQDISAWDHATPGARRMPANKLLVFQCKARTSGGQPNGILYIDILQYNGGAQSGTCGYRQRLNTDVFDTTAGFLAVNGSNITTDHQVYWGVFVPDPAVVTTHFTARIYYQVTNWNGVNVYVTEAHLGIIETLPGYTPEMAAVGITYARPTGGAPTPPAGFDPDDGRSRPWIDLIDPP